MAQCAKPRASQIQFEMPPQFVEVSKTRIGELAKGELGIGHRPLVVGALGPSLVIDCDRPLRYVVMSVPDLTITDFVINVRGLHMQRVLLVKIFVNRRVG